MFKDYLIFKEYNFFPKSLKLSEAKNNTNILISNIKSRIVELSKVTNLELDYTEKSLLNLTKWLKINVISDFESKHDYLFYRNILIDEKNILPNFLWLNICLDSAIYLFDMILSIRQDLFITTYHSSKNSTSYNKPVIMGYNTKNKLFHHCIDDQILFSNSIRQLNHGEFDESLLLVRFNSGVSVDKQG